MYFDAQGALRSMLASWTSLGSQDLFAQASAGRSWFRTDDLVRLSVFGMRDPRPEKGMMVSSKLRRMCKLLNAALDRAIDVLSHLKSLY